MSHFTIHIPRSKWIILGITIVLAFVALWQINRIGNQIRFSETQKVKLWAAAINQKAQLVRTTDRFFDNIGIDEHRKMQMYIDVLQSFNNAYPDANLGFSLAYVNYIVDSCQTPILIVDKDSVITVPPELSGQRLTDSLLNEFSQYDPFHYRLWGMPMTLYYKESRTYSELRHVLDDLSQSFLDEVANNSIFVPVIIVDSMRREVLGVGNIDSAEIADTERLTQRLQQMEDENQPLLLDLPNNRHAYVFYESTPLLRLLSWLPAFYIFIFMVLLIVSYNLFRTAHNMEQNKVWVGLAKETAHQLGTPISSLIAWTDYLQGKTLTDAYADEVRKDLRRLETITHRFSKIGSTPERPDNDLNQTIHRAIAYLESRSPRKIKFVINLPDGPLAVPHNGYLLEWVVENICKNAIDAMNGEGTFTLIASQDAKNIYIDMGDTGKGISPSQQKRIFQPGFTTKQRGWGLGLSLSKRIVEQYHHGRLYLKYSQPGQGSVFRMVLRK
ncbi:MAG: integral membrane sensor signal transduction histidine kinase [bacterium P3]|nr:MAG: integral membrane sensor signal transduction histidine kinase [bacterium P3]KWW41835.1 MAG: integral membrane sensor signal transduction histidine kinase [bacterium F083]